MARSVVLFSIDGLRADGLQQAVTPHIGQLIKAGAHTYAARSVMPSVTLPCHTSMFRGVTPERHGITTNTFTPQVRPVPSIIDTAHRAGKKTASFYNWEQLRDLSDPGSLNISYFVNNCYEADGDLELAEAAFAHLRGAEVDFAFVYLGHTDIAGHDHGWMSAPYLEAIGRADRAIGWVLEAIDLEQTTCIVTSDHGGHGQSHGTDMDEDMAITLGHLRRRRAADNKNRAGSEHYRQSAHRRGAAGV